MNSIVDVFATPYEYWRYRHVPFDEAIKNPDPNARPSLKEKDKLIRTVTCHREAAEHILLQRADALLESHIEAALTVSNVYQRWLREEPLEDPKAFLDYQIKCPHHDKAAVDDLIDQHGVTLADGQYLFHCGSWSSYSDTLTTDRPFSTSFCPQVALRNGEHKGKSYDAGKVELFVIRTTNPVTKAYVSRCTGEQGHEKEVLFASGASLRQVRKTMVNEIKATKQENGREVSRMVPAYVIEIELS